MVFGTPHYMSPEQAMGEVTDHRADIYALGVVMYEMFTGRVPFEADSYMGVLTKHMYMTPTPPSQLPGTARLGALETILLRCLEKKPDRRYATLRELVVDLDRALDGAGEPFAGATRKRAAERSLLADELELPSQDEVALGRSRAAAKPTRGRLLIVVCALFLAGIGCMLALHSYAAAPAPPPVAARLQAPPSAAAPALLSPPEATASGVSRAAAAVPAASSTALPLPEQAGAAIVTAAPAQKAAQRKAPTLAVTTSVAARKVSPVGGSQRSEIVDPWSSDRKGDGR
jgi:serine/threonine-protein kinase